MPSGVCNEDADQARRLLCRVLVPRTIPALVIAIGVSSGLCAILTGPALAQTDPTPWSRQVAIEGQAGYGAPLGIFGLAIDADLLPWLSISGGLGADLFAPEKYYTCPCPGGRHHAALMLRLRRPVWDGATFVAFGAGLSLGSQPDIPAMVVRQDDEVAVEHRFENGVRVRGFAGIGFSLNGPNLPPFAGTVYFGAALGYAVVPNPDHSSGSPISWYGWQPAISDTIAAILGAKNRTYPHVFPAAFAIYGLTAPVIHVAHHRYGRAALSVGLRAVMPVLFWSAASGSGDGSQSGRTNLLIAGAVVAALVDDLALAWAH